ASSFDATAVGFVTDGTRRIDFNATFSATNLATDNPDVHAVVHWALDNPALTIDLDEKLDTPNANEATITIDFTYTYAGETVHLTGTVSVIQSPVSVTADVAVYENGGTEPVAVIRGTADATHNGITITHRDGTQLSPAALGAFVGFVGLGGFLAGRWSRVAWLHVPCALWGAVIEYQGWVCPLTPLENDLRRRAGLAGYAGGFVEHYVLPVLYPAGLTRPTQA